MEAETGSRRLPEFLNVLEAGMKNLRTSSKSIKVSAMSALLERLGTHPAGEPANGAVGPAGAWPVDTPGGRFFAEWDAEAPVTREGQLLFFFQFLKVGGRWEQFLQRCLLQPQWEPWQWGGECDGDGAHEHSQWPLALCSH
jgi:hypothetical protein